MSSDYDGPGRYKIYVSFSGGGVWEGEAENYDDAVDKAIDEAYCDDIEPSDAEGECIEPYDEDSLESMTPLQEAFYMATHKKPSMRVKKDIPEKVSMIEGQMRVE